MTDKEQIIINGIDVGDCNYIIDQDPPKTRGTWGGAIHKEACKIYSKDCKHTPNCYFKQLKRKEQECENLKAEEKYLKQCCQKAGEELAKHSFEYDGKEKNLVVQAIKLNEKYEKFKKAIEEIEKVCIEYTHEFADGATVHYYSSDDILDIINKTKGETNA